MSHLPYVGTELDVFATAENWKSYLRSLFGRHLRGRVLEVGAGIGATTQVFRSADQESWTALEPDAGLAARLRARADGLGYPVDVVVGTLGTASLRGPFHCVLYVDVLEHIEHDAEELTRAAACLEPGGAIVVLSPAHQALYTEFDRAIGHYRRYDRASLRRLTPAGTVISELRYVDSVGMFLSAANRVILHSAAPSLAQVQFWDRRVVPVSRRIDPLLGWRFGKSILGVWRRAQTT